MDPQPRAPSSGMLRWQDASQPWDAQRHRPHMLQVLGQEPQHHNCMPATGTVGWLLLDLHQHWVRARVDAQRVHAEHAAAARGRGTGVPDPVSGRERHALPGKARGRDDVTAPHRPTAQQDQWMRGKRRWKGVGKDRQVSSHEHVERAAEAETLLLRLYHPSRRKTHKSAACRFTG